MALETPKAQEPRRVAVVTGTRAEYGLLRWVIQGLHDHDAVTLQLIVTGAHLSPDFGETWQEIAGDGFGIDAKVDMLVSGSTAASVSKSIGLAVIGLADAFARLQPDIVVVLGDRYEILAAAQAALVAGIPLAHIHGGELSEGAIDDAIRHAVTKMAALHFVAADPYRKRVIQLGESPDRVFSVGAPGLDHLQHTPMLDRDALAASLGIPLERPLFLVTYHPVTSYGTAHTRAAIHQFLEALEAFPEATIVFTQHNADAGGHVIGAAVDAFIAKHPDRTHGFASLGYRRYLSAAQLADVVVGNSSSGIIEVPVLGTPTVNIGPRQDGRLRAPSIIDCAEDRDAIEQAIRLALSEAWQSRATLAESPYGRGDASAAIVSVLSTTDLSVLSTKRFHDLD